MIVLDANILIRAVLGRRVRHLLDTYTAHGVRPFDQETEVEIRPVLEAADFAR